MHGSNTPDKINISIQPFSNDVAIAKDLDKYDIQVRTYGTTGYFKLIHHCTFKSFSWLDLVSHVYIELFMHVNAFFKKIIGVGKPQKFSREVELVCQSTKLFHLERCAIYGI